jgi:hypothetical protein
VLALAFLTVPAGPVAYLIAAPDLIVACAVISTVMAIVAAMIAMWPLLFPPPEPLDIEHAVRELATAVRRQWEPVANERKLRRSTRVTVRLVRSMIGVQGPPVTALPADISQLLRAYGGLGCGRIVLMGGEGTGKSSATILLLLDALNERAKLPDEDRVCTPVPVLFTMTGWDPTETKLIDWLRDRLIHQYPFLKAPNYPTDIARQLLTEPRVAVLLDGLDELPRDLRADALQALNNQAEFRLVLATRTEAMAAAASAGPLFDAVAFELSPLTNAEAADYLESCWSKPSEQWRRLVEHVRTNPGSALTKALATPLMLSLVRDNYAYLEYQQPLLEELVSHPFEDQDEAEDYLLDRVIDAAYRPRGRPRPRYTVEQAKKWLTYAAHEMEFRKTEDLAWWEIRAWRLPTEKGASSTLQYKATALVAGLGPGLVVGFACEHHVGKAVLGGVIGAASGTLVGFLAARRTGSRDGCRKPRQLGRIPWSRVLESDRTRVGTVEGRVDGLVFGLISGLVFGFVCGFGVGCGVLGALAATLLGGLAGAGLGALAGSLLRKRTHTGPPGPFHRLRRLSRDNIGFGLVFALVGGVAGQASALGIGLGVLFGFGVWLILQVIFRLAVGVTLPSADASRSIDPITCWRRDRSNGLVFGLAFGLVFGLVSGAVLMVRAGVRPWTVAALLVWVAVWSGIGLAAGRAYSTTWSASFAFLQLHRQGVAPPRMLRFLEDAHKRGVLRTAGPVYQFRHSRLQNRLAAQYTEPHPTRQPESGNGMVSPSHGLEGQASGA